MKRVERITVAEAAKLAGVAPSTIRMWIDRNAFPGKFVKPKGTRRGMYLIYREAVLDHLKN